MPMIGHLHGPRSCVEHTPKMRATGEQRAMAFLRFEADEMMDLVEFLKASAERSRETR